MGQRDPLDVVYPRLSKIERKLNELRALIDAHGEDLRDVQNAMTALVDTLKPVLSDYAYAKRRSAERRKSLTSWRAWATILLALPIFIIGMIQIVQLVTP